MSLGQADKIVIPWTQYAEETQKFLDSFVNSTFTSAPVTPMSLTSIALRILGPSLAKLILSEVAGGTPLLGIIGGEIVDHVNSLTSEVESGIQDDAQHQAENLAAKIYSQILSVSNYSGYDKKLLKSVLKAFQRICQKIDSQ